MSAAPQSGSTESSAWSRAARGAGIALVCGGLLCLTLNSIGGYAPRPAASPALDVNLASPAALMQIPGIGPQLANNIAANRPYGALVDLRKVPGIGPSTFATIRTYLYVDEATTPLAASRTPSPPPATSSATLAPLLDLNTATAEQLDELPGIGAVLAERIIAARAKQPFVSIDDLDRVRGIGKKTIAKLRPFVRSPDTPAAAVALE